MNSCCNYKCKCCSREYKEKFNYDRHRIYCEFVNKSPREQCNEIESIETLPSIRQMYQLMQEMAIRINKLEVDNAKLKHAQSQKKKVNIIEWLNKSTQLVQPDMTFIDWITNVLFPAIPNFLEIVYKTDLLSGINALFQFVIKNNDSDKLPIRSFDNKTNVFYVYIKIDDNENQGMDQISINKWIAISLNDFDKQLHRISHQFIVEFSRCWFIPNQEKVETDENYKDTYINYYQQIMGGTKMTNETRFQKIRNTLYDTIKQNTKNIIEYEII